MDDTDEFVMLSALQHFVYCPRQFALIHLEQVWEENIFTLRGLRVHEKVDSPSHELIAGVRVVRSLGLVSHEHRLRGIADVVEFLEDGTPFPVEYKVGGRKVKDADRVQLCAQAMCLEEMFGCEVREGALFYAKSKRSVVVDTVREIEGLWVSGRMPRPVADKRCDDCSLLEACMPHSLRGFSGSVDADDVFRVGNE